MDAQHRMAGAMRAARMQLDIATHDLANASTDKFSRAVGTATIWTVTEASGRARMFALDAHGDPSI